MSGHRGQQMIGLGVVALGGVLVVNRLIEQGPGSAVAVVLFIAVLLVAWYLVGCVTWSLRQSRRAAMHPGTCVNVRRMPAGIGATLVVGESGLLLIDARSRTEIIPARLLVRVSRGPVQGSFGRRYSDGLLIALSDGDVVECVVPKVFRIGVDPDLTAIAYSAVSGLLRPMPGGNGMLPQPDAGRDTGEPAEAGQVIRESTDAGQIIREPTDAGQGTGKPTDAGQDTREPTDATD